MSDLISREYLLKVLGDYCGNDKDATITFDSLKELVLEMPSVQPKQTGHDDDMTISVRADHNGWYPNVCGMCANAESELCDWCGDNRNFKKETSAMSKEMVEHYRKLAEHYDRR